MVGRVGSPDRLETLLFQALTGWRQPPVETARRPGGAASGCGAGGAAADVPGGTGPIAGRAGYPPGQPDGAGAGVVVLCGLGGAGKTSVAVEYAHRQLAGCRVVWQFAAGEPAELAAGFAELAVQLGAGDAAGGDPVAQVHAALAQRTDWLLVFDNAPDPAAVAG